MVSGWRIAAQEFSITAKDMMLGEGAYLYGGRWNSKGGRVVYLGSSLAQASIELLVHLGRAEVLNTYHKMEVSFKESWMQHIALADLPSDWAEPSMAPAVQAVGDDWLASQSSLVLQVPSAVIAGEYNFLINIQHPNFNKATLGPITPFNLDPRLVK